MQVRFLSLAKIILRDWARRAQMEKREISCRSMFGNVEVIEGADMEGKNYGYGFVILKHEGKIIRFQTIDVSFLDCEYDQPEDDI